MPLVILCGLPSAGKTTWAKKIQQLLEAKINNAKTEKSPGYNYTVVYHSDDTLSIPHSTYKESNLEKNARGTQMTAVKRDISRSNIVLLDSMAYIKGFRYQLYCEAKGAVTPHCVVHVMNLVDKCIEWNAKRTDPWDENVIRELEMRFEEPNPDTRWDSPLFLIVSDNDEVPIDEMWDALVLKKAPPPNTATVMKPASANNYLQELDKKTQDVIAKIILHQQVSAGGDVVIDAGQNIVVSMPATSVSIAQLQRIRRTFVGLNRMRNLDSDRITPVFVDYVDRSLNNEE